MHPLALPGGLLVSCAVRSGLSSRRPVGSSFAIAELRCCEHAGTKHSTEKRMQVRSLAVSGLYAAS